MKAHLIFLWFVALGVIVCTSQPGINTGGHKIKGDTIPVLDFASAIHKRVPDTFMWNNVTEKITYIPLSSSCLMDGHPVIEYLDDDMCIISEGKSQWINCVDYKGNFLNSFRYVGNGPGEYVYLPSVVYHLKDSIIHVFDNGSYKHIIYNKQGRFFRKINLADSEFNYLLHMQGDSYFFRGSFGKGKSEVIVADTALRMKSSVSPFDSTADCITRGATMLGSSIKACSPDLCLFNRINSDSVFLLTPDGLRLDFILRKGKYVPSSEDVKQFMRWNQYDPFIKGLSISTFPGYYYLQYAYKEQVLGETWSRKTNQIASRSILTRPNQFTVFRGVQLRLPPGTIIKLLPAYISGNKFALFIPADEAMGEVPGVKIREDDNPISMAMELWLIFWRIDILTKYSRAALFLCAPFLGGLVVDAQAKGVVVDGAKRRPLSGVNIYLQKDSVGIGPTDREGEFLFSCDMMTKSDTIVFSHVGYLLLKCILPQLQRLEYEVTLYERPQLLHEVVVNGERPPFFLEWTLLAPLPKPLYSYGGFLHAGKIYVVGGGETLVRMAANRYRQGTEAWEYRSSNMYVYDIATDMWKKCARGFIPHAGHVIHFYNSKVFVLGGKRFSTNRQLEHTDATMEIYDLDKDTLYVDPVNPYQAVDFTPFIYDDCLYATGGVIKEKAFSNKIHTLDLKRGVRYELEDTTPTGRCGRMNDILVRDKVYFRGGYHTAPMWTAASYDLRTEEWQRLCDLKDGVSYPGLASDGSYIYVFENRNLQVYNIEADTVRIYELATLDVENAGLFYWKGTLYVVSGCNR